MIVCSALPRCTISMTRCAAGLLSTPVRWTGFGLARRVGPLPSPTGRGGGRTRRARDGASILSGSAAIGSCGTSNRRRSRSGTGWRTVNATRVAAMAAWRWRNERNSSGCGERTASSGSSGRSSQMPAPDSYGELIVKRVLHPPISFPELNVGRVHRYVCHPGRPLGSDLSVCKLVSGGTWLFRTMLPHSRGRRGLGGGTNLDGGILQP